ncbi:MAG: hypothetical protein RL685_121 [Pseudomonadota bacterium]|jgi:hypothetical protein
MFATHAVDSSDDAVAPDDVAPPAVAAAPARTERALVSALLVLAVIGVVARLVVIWASNGSNDMQTWERFAGLIRDVGVWETYRTDADFNHPPLMALMARGQLALSSALDVPFRVLFKLPPLLSDLGVMALLWVWFRPKGQLWAAAAVALFSCNPISISVTSFHGNTDSLCAGLMFAAAFLHQRGRMFLAGLVLAGAVNVKLIPMILVPGFFILCRDLRGALRLGLGLALGCVPIAVACLVVPDEFYTNALRYRSQLNRWGLITWGFEAKQEYPEFSKLILVQYRKVGRFVILVVASAFALLGRSARWDAVRFGAIAFSAFLFLAPGFGVQYMVWLVPLLTAASLVYGLWWAVLGGAYTVLVYHSFLVPDEWPLRAEHRSIINHTIGLVGAYAWAVLGVFLYRQLQAVLREGRFAERLARMRRALRTLLGPSS